MSFVYFVQAGEGGPIKIGVANDPRARAATLQTGNHQRLTLLLWVPGTQRHEAELHARFKEHRVRGEWFEPVSPLLSFIEGARWALAAPPPELVDERGIAGLGRAELMQVARFVELVSALERADELLYLLKGRERLGEEEFEALVVTRGAISPHLCVMGGAADVYGREEVQKACDTLTEMQSLHLHAGARLRMLEEATGGTTGEVCEVRWENDPPDWGPLSDTSEGGEF